MQRSPSILSRRRQKKNGGSGGGEFRCFIQPPSPLPIPLAEVESAATTGGQFGGQFGAQNVFEMDDSLLSMAPPRFSSTPIRLVSPVGFCVNCGTPYPSAR